MENSPVPLNYNLGVLTKGQKYDPERLSGLRGNPDSSTELGFSRPSPGLEVTCRDTVKIPSTYLPELFTKLQEAPRTQVHRPQI